MGFCVGYGATWEPEMSAKKLIKNFWKFISIFFGLCSLGGGVTQK